jgi:hypothetical protein
MNNNQHLSGKVRLKNLAIFLPIFIIQAVIVVSILTVERALLFVGKALDGPNTISSLVVNCLIVSFGLSGIVLWLRETAIVRKSPRSRTSRFFTNAILLSIVGLVNIFFVQIDIRPKFDLNFIDIDPVDAILVRTGPGSAGILAKTINDPDIFSKVMEPDRIQKIVSFVNSRGKRWHSNTLDPIHTDYVIEFYSKGYVRRYMSAQRGPDILYANPIPGQYYIELTSEEARYLYDLLGATP